MCATFPIRRYSLLYPFAPKSLIPTLLRTESFRSYIFSLRGDMKLVLVLLLTFLSAVLAAEESCVGRCKRGFDSVKKCQCDRLCSYYGSCCPDYETTCRIKTRGDTFASTEDDLELLNVTTTTTVSTSTAAPTTHASTRAPDPEADTCSGRPFDAFMQLKNGSIYAFRGEYFYELDERSVLPGYPKLIKDVWGISGPIDAAFTRINCQGKTYIFKGNKYWRFEDDTLDEDYPRDISVGFSKIPDDVDAAFAIPAPGHSGKEKAFFFKGDQYYQYEFEHQPSHEECVQMTKASPSVLFTRYTDLYCDSWDDLLVMLFQGTQGHHHGPHFISKDWVGIKAPVDAVMAGRLYISPAATPTPAPRSRSSRDRSRKNQNRRSRGRGRGRGKGKGRASQRRVQDNERWSWLPYYYDYAEDLVLPDLDDYSLEKSSQPVQNVFFFKKDKYYRVDLKTKRIDFAYPPYPRSIAKYWLGCKDKPEAEKK